VYSFLKYFLTLSISLIIPVSAQNPSLRLKHIGIEQGLSQSTVHAIVQDAQGFMWFGTEDGLNRYDGYGIKIFKNNPADSNSISDNTILSLLSDSNGDLWIGSRLGGVDRYVVSENKFYHYRFNKEDTSTISDNSVNVLFEDSKGNLWLGTKKGLNRFNKSDGTFTRFNFYNENDLVHSVISITAICEDHHQNLWIGTSKGLYKMDISNIHFSLSNAWNLSGITLYRHLPSNPKSLSGDYIRSLYIDRFGKLWVGTFGTGINQYNETTNTFSHFLVNSQSNSFSLIGNFISSIYEDSKKNIWIAAYDSGLWIFNQQTERFHKYFNDPALTLFEDRSGIIWIGTHTGGVKIFDPHKNHFKFYYDKSLNNDDKENNLITTILEGKDGKLWVGTFSRGLKLFSNPFSDVDKQRKIIRNYKFEQGNTNSISSDKIISICESPDGNIWVGTENEGLNSINPKSNRFIRYKNNPGNINSISSNQITSLYYDVQDDLLWIGFLNGNIDSYNKTTNKFKHYLFPKKSITVIYKGKQSGLWVGTFEGDLNRFDPKSNSFNQFNLPLKSDKSYIKNGIYSLYEESESVLWIGTYGGGLNRLNLLNNSVKTFVEQDGLPNNVVYGILPDNSGNLWLSTNQGISEFSIIKKTFRNYDTEDGLQSNEFNQGASFSSHSGELFFGGVNGFNSFFPDEIENNNYIPPVYITNFKIFDKALHLPNPIPTDSRIELSYSQNFFSFEFTALNYTAPEKNKYEYMLEGFDNDWHKVSAQQRYASYTNLDPGKYTIKVRASNNDGIWNEKGTFIAVIITPPFWMTWWFKSSGIIIFLMIAFIIYLRKKMMLNKEKELQKEISRRLLEKQEEERRRIAGDLHDSLGQSLLVIKNRAVLGLQKKFLPEDLREDLTEISDTASTTLKEVRQIAYHLRPYELDRFGLTEALHSVIEKVERSLGIKFNIDIDNIDNLLRNESEINIYRIIQECLNNIVKHSHALKAGVSIKKDNKSIIIIVQDNGKGFDKIQVENTDKRGSGFDSLNERLRLLDGICSIDSVPDLGTKIMITVPFN